MGNKNSIRHWKQTWGSVWDSVLHIGYSPYYINIWAYFMMLLVLLLLSVYSAYIPYCQVFLIYTECPKNIPNITTINALLFISKAFKIYVYDTDNNCPSSRCEWIKGAQGHFKAAVAATKNKFEMQTVKRQWFFPVSPSVFHPLTRF